MFRCCIHRFAILALLLAAGIVTVWAAGAAEPAKDKDGKPKYTNRLARESSPYLLQHAHNPVNWYPWGDEAFALAKKDGKLIFLSIGYSSCHWCHVMEKESFNDPEVAKIMNEYFICIKVDREERPDVDQIYMTALHVRGQRGGWPLSMFLTPDGKPIWGGTYWPRDDKEVDGEKVLGWKSICKIVHDFWKEKPKEILADADKLADATTRALAGVGRGIALVDLDRDLVAGAIDGLREEFDKVHGGFGQPARQFRGPKFPVPPCLRLIQHEARRTKSAELADMLTLTLTKMYHGGIYDHLGGGFHRYSTERTWTVPHFEKMLYDNAQLVEVYAREFQVSRNPVYRRAIRETLGFVQREMSDPLGGFYSALDADSEGEEGKFYIWTLKEVETVLGDKADIELFHKVYLSDGVPNFEEKYHILRLARPLAETAAELKITEEELEKRLDPVLRKLFDARARRPSPFLDRKVLTSWNGQMIAAFALAGQVLDDKSYVDRSVRAAAFILDKLRTKDGRLLRTWGSRPGEVPAAKLNAYLDDYAYLVHGLLGLHDATGDAKWLDESKVLTAKMVELFLDKDRGGFYYTSHDHEKPFARAKDQYDGAEPSGNSVATRNLVRLWIKTGEKQYRNLAEMNLRAFAAQMKSNPTSMATMSEALSIYFDAQKK